MNCGETTRRTNRFVHSLFPFSLLPHSSTLHYLAAPVPRFLRRRRPVAQRRLRKAVTAEAGLDSQICEDRKVSNALNMTRRALFKRADDYKPRGGKFNRSNLFRISRFGFRFFALSLFPVGGDE